MKFDLRRGYQVHGNFIASRVSDIFWDVYLQTFGWQSNLGRQTYVNTVVICFEFLRILNQVLKYAHQLRNT